MSCKEEVANMKYLCFSVRTADKVLSLAKIQHGGFQIELEIIVLH